MILQKHKRSIFHFVRSFFPIQLLFGHVKYNFLVLFFWAILFGIVTDNFGSKYGIPFLFYSPEYQGEVSGVSFFLMGFALGGFTMAFHTYSYIKLGKRYPFIATVSKPFIKFCLNNSIIPLVFLLYYCLRFAKFQRQEELATNWELFWYLCTFLVGFALFLTFSFIYFFPKNKVLFIKIGMKPIDEDEEIEPVSSFLHRKVNWQNYFKYKKDRVYLYMVTLTRWRTSRTSKHYDKESLEKVFKQSKISSSTFEIITILTFFLIGIFRERHLFDLPAAMSVVMLLTILMMLISAIYSVLHYWTFPALLGLLIAMNALSKHTSLFQYKNYAYGLSYDEKDKVNYNLKELDRLKNDVISYNQSKRSYIRTLNRWKYRTGQNKPKLIVIMTSGGGSRSATWTFEVIQYLNKELKNKLMKQTQMITGASGGMIGAAFYRSLYLKKKSGYPIDLSSEVYQKQISSDLLNKLSFSAYSNDMFFRIQSFKYNDHKYTKDRGFAFEEQLNENTQAILNVPLSYFQPYEHNAIIPTMIFSPTVVNDGRRLYVSSQSLAFMCNSKTAANNVNNMYENIDFNSFFKKNNDVRFLSVLRMSCTFPLVLPMVSMPTKPEMHIMDAGIRDNYGGKVTMEYLFALKDWIKENTSGVIILKVRDTKKVLDGETVHKVSLLNKFTLPFGNMYGNFPRTQDFDQDELFKIGAQGFDFPIDLVVFNLRESEKDRISLSWHLTTQEKAKIKKALWSEGNQLATKQLKMLLK